MIQERPKPPPRDSKTFFVWLRKATEDGWRNYREKSTKEFSKQNRTGYSWRQGTRWKPGLNDLQIDEIEQKFELRFPQEYRQYLSILNAPNMPCKSFGFTGSGKVKYTGDKFLLHDWSRPIDEVLDNLNWPVNGWQFDLNNDQGWYDFMGPKPNSSSEQTSLMQSLVNNAPPAIPLSGHRYLVNATPETPGIVLSIYQTDVILFANSFREFLLSETAELTGYFDEAVDYKRGIAQLKNIPVWGDLVLQEYK